MRHCGLIKYCHHFPQYLIYSAQDRNAKAREYDEPSLGHRLTPSLVRSEALAGRGCLGPLKEAQAVGIQKQRGVLQSKIMLLRSKEEVLDAKWAKSTVAMRVEK